jgi:23S rRNA pseudouridine1911/1915/1917 synthase
MKRDVKRFTIPEPQSGPSIEQVLPLLDPTLSDDLVQNLFDFGSIHLNGRRCGERSRKVNLDDKIEIFIDGLPFEHFVIDESVIVYRDDNILVINKPAGIDCQPTPSRFMGTVYSALLSYLANPYRRDLKPSIGMLQRLDRDTSGLMVFSIHPRAHKSMSEKFTAHTIEKKYVAIVAGRMAQQQGEFKSLLAKSRVFNRVKSVEKGGKEAITRYRVIRQSDTATLVDIDLLTGRSHQIRAHFSEAGHPLLGDLRYDGPAMIEGHLLSRQMLHAGNLSFIHPVSRDRVSFEASLPVDMDQTLQKTLLAEF